jgi:hypothetical protein
MESKPALGRLARRHAHKHQRHGRLKRALTSVISVFEKPEENDQSGLDLEAYSLSDLDALESELVRIKGEEQKAHMLSNLNDEKHNSAMMQEWLEQDLAEIDHELEEVDEYIRGAVKVTEKKQHLDIDVSNIRDQAVISVQHEMLQVEEYKQSLKRRRENVITLHQHWVDEDAQRKDLMAEFHDQISKLQALLVRLRRVHGDRSSINHTKLLQEERRYLLENVNAALAQVEQRLQQSLEHIGEVEDEGQISLEVERTILQSKMNQVQK